MSQKLIDQDYELLNHITMPKIGLGTYRMTDLTVCSHAISEAINSGYRLIDTAEVYRNADIVVAGIQHSNQPREALFITSKVWNADHQYDRAVKAIDKLLTDLQTTYLDLVLIHWPTPLALECWKALEEAYEAGKIRAIGVSNFPVAQLDDFIKQVTIPPMVNQIEMHPGLNRSDVLEYCQKHHIIVTAWESLGNGKYLNHPVINQLATKHRKTPAQICLKWALQMGVAIIPKSNHPARNCENSNLDDFNLDDSDMYAILTLPQEIMKWDVAEAGPEIIAWHK